MSGEHWTIEQVADHWGSASTAAARRALSRAGITGRTMYPADQIRAIHRPGRGARTDLKETAMTATTQIASWHNLDGGSTVTLEDSVTEYLGDFTDSYDVEGLCDAYRNAINSAMPEGVSLAGDTLYGPYLDDPEAHDEMMEQVREAYRSVDLADLLEEFDKDVERP